MDPNKEKVNRRKHGIAFKEAVSVFKDKLGITIYVQIIPRKRTGSSHSDSRQPVVS